MKCGVDAGRLAQQFQVDNNGIERGRRGHGLKVDRDFGANYVKAYGGLEAAPRPSLRGQYVRGGQV